MSTTLVQNPPRSPESRPRRSMSRYTAIALACLLASALVRGLTGLDDQGATYRPKKESIGRVVSGDWFAGMLLGFREMVADLMWIQVDEYFHEGRFDKILPVCYVITALDPGWIDVYTTGAWHLGYNFGDRRLVPAAVEFDALGTRNNPLNYDMWYELGWMEMSRGYDFKSAAVHLQKANSLHLLPLGKRHAWPHALEAAGDVNGAIAAWQQLLRENPGDIIAKKQIYMANLRLESRKDLAKNPVDVHLNISVTRKGPRVLHIQGVCNLPKYSKWFFELRDADWQQRSKKSLAWQMEHYTLYSQNESTLLPSWGLFRGTQVDFYQSTLRIHQKVNDQDKTYEQFPTEPMLPVVNGHMIVTNGEFHGDIDMAKIPTQYPLESGSYELRFYVNPRIEPINTQDLIGWNGEGMSGPLVHRNPEGYNEAVWTHTLKKSDIE